MRRTFRDRLLAGACIIGFSFAASAHAADSCASLEEMEAVEARVLQTELMVAALTCKQSSQYNAFVTQHKKELMSQGKMLKNYFARVHGRSHESKLNSFVTSLANQVSRRSMGKALPAYCSETAGLFQSIQSPKSSLKSIASSREYASLHGQKPCLQMAKATTTGVK